MVLPKKTIYAINILLLVCIVFLLILFSKSIISNYKKILKLSYSIEKEYNDTLSQYKKIAVFVLKNNLPQDINYFNSISNTIYNLPSIKQLKIDEFNKNIATKKSDDKTLDNEYLVNILGCHNNKCIRVFVDKYKVLSKVSKNELWHYGAFKIIPLKKTTLFKIAVSDFLVKHKNLLFILLICFCILYLSQSIILLIKYFKLSKKNTDLSATSNKNEQDLIIKTEELDRLYNILPSIYELTDEYFAHYAHTLISGSVNVSDIDLTYVFQKLEKFLAPQIIKKNLRITLDGINSAISLKSDTEILFIVLLNLMFRSISRAKISSEILVKLSVIDDIIYVEINDVGYKYQPKQDNKIKIYMLPELLLDKLCQKIKIANIKESRNGEVNSIVMEIINTEIEKSEEIKSTNEINNVIKIKINPICS